MPCRNADEFDCTCSTERCGPVPALPSSIFAFVIFLTGACLWLPASATSLVVPDERGGRAEPELYAVPYAFTSETTGAALGAAVVALGYGQPQQAWMLNAIGGSGSYALYLYGKDTQLFERLFLDTRIIDGHWDEVDSYRPGNPKYPNQRGGANGSDIDNYVESSGDDDYYRLKLRYVLPLGSARDESIHTYRTRGGLLVPESAAGGWAYNPFRSGRTFFENEFFYREQDFKDEFDGHYQPKTAGINWALEYDNTDWTANPSLGSRTRVEYSRDWGGLGSDNAWTAIRFDFRKYWSLGETAAARQRVIAFNVWTSDVPTWNSGSADNPQRPPIFAGSTLGGWERMRAYPEARYNDRSALYYGLEYRHVPAWNPFPYIPLINKLPIPWWEIVVFGEAGRVAPTYSLDTLHRNMDWDAGIGVRARVIGIIVRLDAAKSPDAFGVQMTVGHPW